MKVGSICEKISLQAEAFSYEWFHAKILFDTEAKDNSEIQTGSIFVCGPLHLYVKLSSILGAVGFFKADMLLIFYMVWP